MSNETTFVFRLQDQTGAGTGGQQDTLRPGPAPLDPGYGVPPGAPPRSTIPFSRASDAGDAAAGQAGTYAERVAKAEERRVARLEASRLERDAAASLHEDVEAVEPAPGEVVSDETAARAAKTEKARLAEIARNNRQRDASQRRSDKSVRERQKGRDDYDKQVAAARVQADAIHTENWNRELNVAQAKKATEEKEVNVERDRNLNASAAEAERQQNDARRQQAAQERGSQQSQNELRTLTGGAVSQIPGIGPAVGRVVTAAGPYAAVAAAAAIPIVAGRAVSNIAQDRAETLRYFSPEVAAATAVSEVALLMRDIRSQDRIGPIVSKNIIASTELEIATKNLQDVVAEQALPIVIEAKEAASRSVGLFTRLAEKFGLVSLAVEQSPLAIEIRLLNKLLKRLDTGKGEIRKTEFSVLSGEHLPDWPEMENAQDADHLEGATAAEIRRQNKIPMDMPE